MKRCSKCGELKPLDEFYKNATSSDGHDWKCKSCANKYHKLYSKTNSAKVKVTKDKYVDKYPHRKRASGTLSTHKQRGMKVSITLTQVENLFAETTHCPICGRKLDCHSRPGFASASSPSLDRIDNDNEIRIDNVWVICKHCNTTKQDRTLEEFYEYCKMVVSKWPMKTI